MLAKTVQKQGQDWDEHLPYVLYAYRTSIQESTKESFFTYYMVGMLDCLQTKLSTPIPYVKQSTWMTIGLK